MDSSALEFFQSLQRAFQATLGSAGRSPAAVDRLLARAFDTFDGNVGVLCEDEPPLACGRGCAACCTLRVTATAPELLLAARFLRAVQPRLQARGIDLVGALREADRRTRGRSEAARVGLRQPCAFVARGACAIYAVRPLACRAHASHDRRACALAAAGRQWQVPVSEGHRLARSLVQNAMQAALREAGLAWALYELNHGLALALEDDRAEARWLEGEDPFAAAAIPEMPAAEMAAAFDRLSH